MKKIVLKSEKKTNRVFWLLLGLFCFAVTPLFGQLVISKEAPAEAHPGDLVTYKLIYQNTGTTVLKNVEVIDTIPAFDGIYVGSSPQGVLDPATGIIKWTKNEIPEFANLNAGEGIIYIYGRAGMKINDANHYSEGLYLTTSPKTLKNQAWIYTEGNFAGRVGSGYETTVFSQTCTATINQGSGVIKSATSSEYKYVVAITNTGNIWNKWTLSSQDIPQPNGSVLTASFEDMNGVPLTNNQTKWLQPGATTTVILKLVSPKGTNPSIDNPHDPNVTRVTATPVACGDPVYKDFTTEICGGNCSPYQLMSVNKIDNPDPVQSGDSIVYEVILYNAGDVALTNVLLTETYPSAYTTFVRSTTPTAPATMTGNNQWLFASLPPGMTTFKITLKLDENIPNDTKLVNHLELSNAGTLYFFYDEYTLVKSAPDLYINKSVTPDYGIPGDEITYTLIYGNTGNYKAENVQILDNYDEYYMDVVDNGGGTASGGNLTWNIGTMGIGSADTITYKLKIKPDAVFAPGVTNILNNVNVYFTPVPSTLTEDSNYDNNHDNARVYVTMLPDLKIEKTSTPERVKGGNILTYTITASNIGDVSHTGEYTVTDYLSSDVEYTSSSPAGVYDPVAHTVTWKPTADLGIDATTVFTIQVKEIAVALAGKNIINKATVYSTTWSDKDIDNNEVTIQTPVYPNLWVGTTDATTGTNWNLDANWVYSVPAENEDVTFATTENYTTAAVNDLVLDQDRIIKNLTNKSDKNLKIPAEKALTVTGTTVTNNVPAQIQILAEADKANGTLIFTRPDMNQDVFATVEMWSKAYRGELSPVWIGKDNKPYRTSYRWQYFGIPVATTPTYGPLGGSMVAEYQEGRKLDDYYDKWETLKDGSTLTATKGYAITQQEARKVTFTGKLVVGSKPLTVYSSQSPTAGSINYYSGKNLISNPYTTPIDIASIQFPEVTGFEKTVYLFNTGSFNEWGTTQADGGDIWGSDLGTPGTYFGIPQNTGGFISSMQGFMVNAPHATGMGYTVTLPYATTGLAAAKPIMKVQSTELTGIAKAEPVKTPTDLSYMSVEAVGKTGGDRVWLFSQEGTSHAFDNGWDARKIDYSPWVNIHATEESGDYQVNTAENLDGTFLSFKAGEDTEYTLRIRKANLKGYSSLIMTDLVTGKIVDLSASNDISYSFTATNTAAASKRFLISGTKADNDKDNKGKDVSASQLVKIFSAAKTIKIHNRTDENGTVRVSDMLGNLVLTDVFNANSMTEIKTNLPAGVYTVRVKSSSIDLTEKVAIKK